MNKSYIYIDGKVIVTDDNGVKEPVEYYDNIDEVLVQENLVETMEERIQELEELSEKYKKINKGHYFPVTLPIAALMAIIAPLLVNFLSDGTAFTTPVNTAFGSINALIFYSICALPGLLIFSWALESMFYLEYKGEIKEEKGINSELEFLKKQIELEREHLETLKQEKTRANESTEFREVEVNDVQQIGDLKGISNLYFNLGYDDKKLYRLYRKGQLDKKLAKDYNEDEIELAKEYLEEKGPILEKKCK